jgi:alpha-glucosidase (family GH31 glycosyl hydrolase)
MDEKRLFTLDPVNYPEDRMRAFVDGLHANNQHYVIIVDPGIRFEAGYSVYDEALAADILIRTPDGESPAIGKVWPGAVAFPDWSHPNAPRYWYSQIEAFHHRVPFDGLWIDMNEIASFCDGHCELHLADADDWADLFTCPCKRRDLSDEQVIVNVEASPADHWNFPPFWPGGLPPDASTISMASLWYNQKLEYDWHSLYGHMESVVTSEALRELTGKRSFVITRSSFASTGHHVGHWLGDNSATWEDMRFSIAGMLNMNMFGIPLVGADICGFVGDTHEELCARWMQLGSMYPFSRNHNGIGYRPQEPYALGDTVLSASTASLTLRYSLLPYFYTQLWHVAQHGGMLVRPLMFLAPTDRECRTIDTQFVVGRALLVSPALHPGVSSVRAYFPAGAWYHLLSGAPVANHTVGRYARIAAPLSGAPPLHIAGGSVIVRHTEAHLTTAASRHSPLHIVAALSPEGLAHGSVVLDDGESLQSPTSMFNISALLNPVSQAYRSWHLTGSLYVTASEYHYHPPSTVLWSRITIYGLPGKNTPEVWIGNSKESYKYTRYDADVGALDIYGLDIPTSESFEIYWEALDERQTKSGIAPLYLVLVAVILLGGCVAFSILGIVAYKRRKQYLGTPNPNRARPRVSGPRGFSLVDTNTATTDTEMQQVELGNAVELEADQVDPIATE